ncbi:MAG: 1,4-alpha-glucan branching protein GlgB [Clostridia bacterium]
MSTLLTRDELYLWGEGTNAFAYRALGCHKTKLNGNDTFRFAVWAPNAKRVSVVGSFNGWNENADVMFPAENSGVWQIHIGIAHKGDTYKYAILTQKGELIYKADPFAFFGQLRPNTASIVWDIDGYKWQDGAHMERRKTADIFSAPMSIYEVHLGSWKRGLDYDGLSEQLVSYAVDMGYTHIELMPVSEYPLDDSWGYQVTGYYAITSRYGTPQQFKHFVDCCHTAGLSVIMDWVPAHFTRDEQGLRRFDGTALFENPDVRRSEQPQWGTVMFDYGRNQVRSFLISNAVFLLTEYHIDALRVDAVSCMLYLDYGRDEYMPNKYGGRENLEAIEFIKQLTQAVHTHCPGALLIAEESSSFPLVTGDVERGGLGFDLKWNMGWMNDTLAYMHTDSINRRYHHNLLTFPMCYAFAESHVLPLSHDEVVHGKCSLISKMPGTYGDMFRQLRVLLMYQYAHPGKKLMFMGGEFGQFIEWNFHNSLDWFLLTYPSHSDMQSFTRELNRFYTSTPALYEVDDNWDGFTWLAADDTRHSVIAFMRRDAQGNELLCAFNFTPVKHEPYRIRLLKAGRFTQVMSSVDMSATEAKSRSDAYGDYLDIVLSPYEAVYYINK